MDENIVLIEDFAKRHFIKNFEKKYKNKWDITIEALKEMLSRIDQLIQTQNAETIIAGKDIDIIKIYFKIAGTNESAKSSGNRCIVSRDKNKKLIKILLVYAKTDIQTKNETSIWKMIIRNNYKEYKSIITI